MFPESTTSAAGAVHASHPRQVRELAAASVDELGTLTVMLCGSFAVLAAPWIGSTAGCSACDPLVGVDLAENSALACSGVAVLVVVFGPSCVASSKLSGVAVGRENRV